MKVQADVHSKPCSPPLTSPPLKDKYEPKDFYCDVEIGIYYIDCHTTKMHALMKL